VLASVSVLVTIVNVSVDVLVNNSFSIGVHVGGSVESVLASVSVLATIIYVSIDVLVNDSFSIRVHVGGSVESVLISMSMSAPAQKALSDTADLIRDINPLFGF
jgi:accessory gene regulator protein AgrB